MADNDPTDVATLEAEVAAARARFARTLDKLTDPATHEAMKNEVMERVEGYKDGLLGSVEASARAKGQGVVDDLKTRAMNNPAGAALIGAGIAYHLYRHPTDHDAPRRRRHGAADARPRQALERSDRLSRAL